MSDITVKPGLDEIVGELGRYFGIVSKNAFLNHLTLDKTITGLDITNESAPSVLGDVILSMQEGGKSTHDIIRQISEKLRPTGPEDPLIEKIASTMRITYEPTTDAKTCIAINGHSAGSKLSDQGSDGSSATKEKLKDGEEGENKIDVFSIKKTLGLPETNDINRNPEMPDRETSPALSVIQMFPSALSPANRDTGAISLFLNAISTLEISRAVPFVDIVSIARTPALSPDTNETGAGRITHMSLGQFLLGNDIVRGNDAALIGAIDAEVIKDPPPPINEEDEGKIDMLKSVGTAGMELFTSPQTLVNADEVHFEFDSLDELQRNVMTGETDATTMHPGGKRAAPVIDRFRPFLSLVDFKVNVTSSKGMMSYKSAKLSIVLHDRSRLTEIAPFVKPDSFGDTHFLIEYGWAHPDNKVHEFRPLGSSTTMAQLNSNPDANLIGLFISHLRCREKYHVVNSSFSFDEVGQVQIEIDLAMLGGEDAYNAKIGHGGEVEEQFKAVKRITTAIAEIQKKINNANASSDEAEDVTGDGNVLNIASSTESAINLSAESQKQIKLFLSKNRGKSTVQELDQLKNYFKELLGPNGDGKGGVVATLNKSVTDEINRKMVVIRNGYDPWIRKMSLGDKSITDKNIKNYVSLAKLLTVFIGMPMANTRKFDDIQICFYSFNDKASFAKDMNIGQFPIDINDLDVMLKEELKLEPNMYILKFINFINKAFVNDQGAIAYGMTGIFGERDKENKTKRKVSKKFEEDGSAMFGEKQKILKSAYGEGSELSFKLPSLQFNLEAVPAAKKTESSDGVNEPGADKTIMRLQIFDSQCTSFSCLAALLNIAKKEQLGVITKSAGNVINKSTAGTDHQMQFNIHLNNAINQNLLEPIPINETGTVGTVAMQGGDGKRHFRLKGGFPALKNFVMRSMPSVVYGSQNTGIIKASVQSMQNPLLATANMQRQGLRAGEDPQGKRDAGVPMTVHPVECTLETIGCAIWSFGQHVFIDFGTGTTIDNIYVVYGFDHSIKAGEFRSSVKMRQLTAWGVYDSMIDTVTKANAIIADKTKDTEEDAAKSEKAGL
jgi:hypothetical protein